jgi:hypothetical protein
MGTKLANDASVIRKFVCHSVERRSSTGNAISLCNRFDSRSKFSHSAVVHSFISIIFLYRHNAHAHHQAG